MVSFFHELIAGGFAGGTGVFCGHPLDTVRIRLQSESIYKNTIDCLRKTVGEEGIRGLYRGLVPPVAGATLVNAILFYTYSSVEHQLMAIRERRNHNKNSEINLHAHSADIFLAGALAGAATCIITTPVELLKCRLQVSHEACSSALLNMGKQVYKQGGYFRGLNHGFAATLVRETPSFGAYYLSYFHIKNGLVKITKTEENRMHQLLAGGFAGSVSWGLCYPFDVMKTRIQTMDPNNGISTKYRDVFKRIVKAEGVKPFYRGFSTTLIRAFPVSAITFVLYEACLDYLEPQEETQCLDSIPPSPTRLLQPQHTQQPLAHILPMIPVVTENCSKVVRYI